MRSTFSLLIIAAATAALGAVDPANATGLATCDSGPQESWQPQSKLEEALTARGWEIRMIKVDGGCYEVYALDENKERVEAYFHPKTLERVPVKGE